MDASAAPMAPSGDRKAALDIARRALAHHRANRLSSAAALYRVALALAPDDPEVLTNLGAIHLAQGRNPEAHRLLLRALRLLPGYRQALGNLGVALRELGRLDEAAAVLEAVLTSFPDDVGAMNSLGLLHQGRGDLDGAIREFECAIAANPDAVEPRANLASLLGRIGELTRAIGHVRQALRATPESPDLLAMLGNLLVLSARHDEARTVLFAPVDWSSATPASVGVRLFTLNALGDVPADEIASLHSEAGRLLEARATPVARAVAMPAGGRPLRVGYVSPDFGLHPVGRFLLPVFAAHDRREVAVHAYADVATPDALGDRLQALSDVWRPTLALSHDELAGLIAADGIDLLIDLAGHTANNRLPVFARRPAPVQASWLGYANTTGLTAIDYRITDAIADPPGLTDHLHCETLVRLPGSFLCFDPPDPSPPVSASPCAGNGHITFGSFNALAKLTPAVVALWGRLLASVPRSRLVIKTRELRDPPTRRRLAAAFAAAGAPAGSLTLLPATPDHGEHLASYAMIDVALDPFPYNGTTTTCEALFMGVPVVTLAGSRHIARVGASLLTWVGLGHLVAADTVGYLEIARSLAGDPDWLTTLRKNLRLQVVNSPLCDARRFARQLEDAYRWMVLRPAQDEASQCGAAARSRTLWEQRIGI